MDKRELAFTKQAIMSTKDWDVYQAIMRKCLRGPVNDLKTMKKPIKA